MAVFFEKDWMVVGVGHLYTPHYNKNQLPKDSLEESVFKILIV